MERFKIVFRWINAQKVLFILLGSIIGFSQMWRVPMLCYHNGGIAFLTLYGIFLTTVGNTAAFLEAILGQYTSKPCVTAFKMIPMMHGVAYSTLIYSSLYCIFYSQMVTYLFFYFIASFHEPIPWTICTPHLMRNNSYNCSYDPNSCENCKSPSEYFWKTVISWEFLENDPKFGNIGELVNILVTSAISTWILFYYAAFQPYSVSVLVSTITTLIYYPIVIFLSIYAFTIDGATDGVKRLFIIDWTYIIKLETWVVAMEQAFCSMGVGLTLLPSKFRRLPYSHDSQTTLTIVPFIVFFSSVISTLFVFAMLGIVSKRTETPFQSRVDGPGMYFTVLSEATAFFPSQRVLAMIMYVILISMTAATLGALIRSIWENLFIIWPITLNYTLEFSGIMLFLSFLVGLPIICRNGLPTYFRIFDQFVLRICLFTLVAVKFFAISFGYGISLFCEDIAFMFKRYPNRFYRYHWLFGGFFILGLNFRSVFFPYDRYFRTWGLVVASATILFIILPTFIVAAMKFRLHWNNGYVKRCIMPDSDYAPFESHLKMRRGEFSSDRKIW